MSNGIPHTRIELSSVQIEALTGSMLGDGCILKPKWGNAFYRVARSIKDEEYLKYESSLFSNFLTTRFKEIGIAYTSHYDKTYKKVHNDCLFYTQKNPIFTEWQDKWYNNRTKIVPSDIELSSRCIAHWFADDGCIEQRYSKYRFGIRFSTQGFSLQEVELLTNLLNKRYNERFDIHKCGSYHTIFANDTSSRVLISDIDPYFMMIRKRVWDDPESRFYLNCPAKQSSWKESSLKRRNILEDIINIGEPISMFELAKKLNYLSHDNKPYRNLVDRLLKPYIKANVLLKEKIGSYCIIKINK